jgi:DNA anti-recombination protein RmuC
MEEQDLLQRWYARLDQEEAARLSAAPVPSRLADLQARVEQATAQVVEQAQRIERLTAENAQLRQEIVSLQRLLTATRTGQPA